VSNGPGRFGPLLPRSVVGSVAGLCLVLSLVMVGSFRTRREAVLADAGRTLQTVASLKAEQVAGWHLEQLQEAAHLNQSRVFSQLFSRLLAREPGAPQELREWLAPLLVENPSWHLPVLLDNGMTPVATGGVSEEAGIGEQGRAHAAAAIAAGRPLLSELPGRESSDPVHFDLAIPIKDERGTALGLVFIRIDPAVGLESLLQVRGAGRSSLAALLVDAEGKAVRYLGRERHPGDGASQPFPPAVLPAAAAGGGARLFTGPDDRGIPVMAAFAVVAGSPWRVVAKIDLEEIEAPLRRSVLITAAMALLLVLAAVGMVGAIWERQHRLSASRLLASERSRLAAAARYEALMRHANDGILLADEQLRIIDVNARLEERTGYSREELLRLSVADLRAPAARPDLEQTLERARRSDGGIYETLHQRKDGAAYPVEVSVRFFEEGGRRLLIANVRDISERRRLEARARSLNEELEQRVAARTAALEEANRELESFSYSVSHDLRAPLRAIEGFSGILTDEYGAELSPEAQRLLRVVSANTRRMSRLIDDLLAFSRLGRTSLRAEAVDMGTLVEEVLDMHRPPAGWTRVDLAIGELPPCHGDAALLRQVWANLLGNALKFSAKRERAQIGVDGARRDGELVYRVADNGAGFDMRYADKLFGIFQRLHDPAQYEGTGVGLAIVQRIVRRHGGRVWAESHPDGGATFSFALPARTPPPAAQDDPAAPVTGTPRAPLAGSGSSG